MDCSFFRVYQSILMKFVNLAFPFYASHDNSWRLNTGPLFVKDTYDYYLYIVEQFELTWIKNEFLLLFLVNVRSKLPTEVSNLLNAQWLVEAEIKTFGAIFIVKIFLFCLLELQIYTTHCAIEGDTVKTI